MLVVRKTPVPTGSCNDKHGSITRGSRIDAFSARVKKIVACICQTGHMAIKRAQGFSGHGHADDTKRQQHNANTLAAGYGLMKSDSADGNGAENAKNAP